MPRFIAIHPGAFPEEQLVPLTKEPMPEGVTWNSTYVALTEGKTYCHWEAPSRDAVLEVLKKYEIPYEAVQEVRWFDPVTATFEPVIEREKVLQEA